MIISCIKPNTEACQSTFCLHTNAHRAPERKRFGESLLLSPEAIAHIKPTIKHETCDPHMLQRHSRGLPARPEPNGFCQMLLCWRQWKHFLLSLSISWSSMCCMNSFSFCSAAAQAEHRTHLIVTQTSLQFRGNRAIAIFLCVLKEAQT